MADTLKQPMVEQMWRVSAKAEFRSMSLEIPAGLATEAYYKKHVAATKGITLSGYWRVVISVWRKGHSKDTEYVFGITEDEVWEKTAIRTNTMVELRRSPSNTPTGPKAVS